MIRGFSGGGSQSIALGVYGDGSDSDVTITSGTTTLSRNMYYNDLTIASGGLLDTNAFMVYCKGTLTINANGTVGVPGNAPAAATGGAARGNGAHNGGAAGGNGATGAGVAGGSLTSLAGSGGAGGSTGSAGGAGGATNAWSDTRGSIRSWFHVNLGGPYTIIGSDGCGGGGGGGGGGGDGVDSGGGGGGGGGALFLSALTMVVNGTISVRGAAGASATSGNCGGGGGGGGGLAVLTYRSFTGNAVAVSGGAGGSGIGTGANGTAGDAGVTISFVM